MRKGQKTKYNKYERALLFNLEVMKAMFLGIVLLNFFLPLFSPFGLGITSVFQWVLVLVHLLALLNGLGYFSQRVPILELFFLRLIQLLWYQFISSKDFNWVIFGILVIVDVLFVGFLLMDKSAYKYEVMDLED